MSRPSVVQFVHPGFEYTAGKYVGPKSLRYGVMRWKEGRSVHDRKFMWTQGSALDPETATNHEDVPLTLWGEWEGPSVYWRVDSPGKPLASIVHSPFRPEEVPTSSVQNTDPMVFGDNFIYSNCRQHRHPKLRSLPPGSIILFGRLADPTTNPSFSLDTCFVVDEVRRLPAIPFGTEEYGSDLLNDTALCPLFTEDLRGDLGVHFGRSREDGELFSFFPAQISEDKPSLFARPQLRPTGALTEVISPGTQGVNMTHDLSESERDAIWKEVVKQVAEQGCVLGHRANPPPLLEEEDARRAARERPRPLTAAGF